MYKKPYRYWDTLVDMIDMGSLKQIPPLIELTL